MKKSIIALLALAGVAAADYTIETDSSLYTNPNAWLYVWTGDGENSNWDNGNNWAYYQSAGDDTADVAAGQKPVNADPAFIGYDFTYENGKQYLTANNTEITVTTPTWMGGNGRIYLGNVVTLYGTNNGFSSNQTITFNFGDFSGSSVIEMGSFWMQGGATVNFAGNITLTESDFSYTLFTSSNMAQIDGTWNAEAVTVTDANGEALLYAVDESDIGKAGYYWIETTGTKGGAYSVSLVAKTIPEPATATLSLLALAGLAARRRRR